MELLDSVLRICKAGDYVENFLENDVDLYSLQLLNDEDLKIIGIQETNIRENILSKAKDLKIPLDKKIDIHLNKNYIIQVLYQIKHQLHLNNINLLYGLARDDIIICNNQMYNAALCLEHCVNSFENTLEQTEIKIGLQRNKLRKKKKTLILLVSSTLLLTVCARFYFCSTK